MHVHYLLLVLDLYFVTTKLFVVSIVWLPSLSTFWYSFSSCWLLQRGSIVLCGWSSPCHRPPMLLWQSERSSSWTLASRSKHSSTPPGSTEIKHQCHKLDCCCRLQSTVYTGYLLLWVFLSLLLRVDESNWVLREPKGNLFEVQRAMICHDLTFFLNAFF